jgi:hypothetical protein
MAAAANCGRRDAAAQQIRRVLVASKAVGDATDGVWL